MQDIEPFRHAQISTKDLPERNRLALWREIYGRGIANVDIEPIGDAPFHAVFIRAPVVERAGSDVEVLATVDGKPVLVRHGQIVAAAFHPELSDDDRIHRLFLEGV